jgi:hypothetical protein
MRARGFTLVDYRDGRRGLAIPRRGADESAQDHVARIQRVLADPVVAAVPREHRMLLLFNIPFNRANARLKGQTCS